MFSNPVESKDKEGFKLCECGCGELIPLLNKRGEPAKYKHGHHRRGKHHTEEAKQRLREINTGEKNPRHKGDNVGYSQLHERMRTIIPKPESCEQCHMRPSQDLANTTQVYNTNKKNWTWLCDVCHWHLDIKQRKRNPVNGRFEKFKGEKKLGGRHRKN